MSQLRKRPPAAAVSLLLGAVSALTALGFTAVSAAPADTWELLSVAPASVSSPVLALAAEPGSPNTIVYGTAAGDVYRSGDAGATWARAGKLSHGVNALGFDPSATPRLLAGTNRGGIWASNDLGTTWRSLDHGSETVRQFAFGHGVYAAATDAGVMVTNDGLAWSASGLARDSISAVGAGGGRLVAGADVTSGAQGLQVFSSPDGGTTWNQLKPPGSAGTLVGALESSPDGVLMGTNTGLYESADGGATWTGAPGLPSTDFSTLLGAGNKRVYAASDGGASERGGLWATDDAGQSFRSLQPPIASVTALAISGPALYVATFRPVDHSVMIWSYADDGASAQPPAQAIPSPSPLAASPGATAPGGGGISLRSLLTGPELPFVLLAVVALLVILFALIAYARRGRD